VAEKRFRQDLFYRLNVIPIILPPLRRRKEDIPVLISHFMAKFNEKKQKNITGISDEARDLLMDYPWPGNIRELENIIERMIVLRDEGGLTVEDLPVKITETKRSIIIAPFRDEPVFAKLNGDAPILVPEPAPALTPTPQMDGFVFEIPPEGVSLTRLVADFENRLIKQALAKANGVKSQAALLLGLNRTTLVEKMKRRGIEERLTETKTVVEC
jgi:DNA-binding NtrC family response regulator